MTSKKIPVHRNDTVHLAVDPSLVKSGVALLWPPGPENEFEVMESAVVSIEEVGSWLDSMDCCGVPHVVLGIEIPPSGKGRRRGHTFSTQPVKSAVNAWKRAVKRRARRKNTIIEMHPEEWRAWVYGSGTVKHAVTDNTFWKQRAVAQVKKMGHEVKDHNEAEAVLILDYLTSINWRYTPNE